MSLVDIGVAVLALSSSYFLKKRDDALRYPALKIEQLFVYPIKSLPPISVHSATLTDRSFRFDRSFVLLSPLEGKWKVHLISGQPKNALLLPSISDDSETLTITSPSGASYSVPLVPQTEGLKLLHINLHQSPVDAYDLGEEASAFFSEACGEVTRLAWVGLGERRKVLGAMAKGPNNGLAFQDCASYMVATTSSLNQLSTLLGRPMSIIPLRPSILLSPANPSVDLQPWVEDYWAQLKIGETSIVLTSNCVRCVSLNVDYSTGKPLTVEDGALPLAALAKERRVDSGTPYSPVFGRYGFSSNVGNTLSVGDQVSVTRLNKKRTVFEWPGM